MQEDPGQNDMSSLAAVLEFPTESTRMPLLGLPAEQPAKKQLTNPVDRVLRNIVELLHEMLGEVLEARTREDFKQALEQSFPQYVGLVRSFSEIVTSRVAPQAIERLAMDSLLEFEADLRANGVACFGAEMTERALFTVWTLRRITGLLGTIVNSQGALEAGDIEKDQEFANKFFVHALVSRFCVDCLVIAMQTKQAVLPEVLKQMDDYLRAAVDAYAWIRQAADLRVSKPAKDTAAIVPLDMDEQQLLNESMIDLARDKM